METALVRIEAIKLYAQGLSPDRIASILNTSVEVLADLVSKYITF